MIDTYDVAMLAVLIVATGLGAWKGFAWQVASLAALFASYLVAYRYRQPVAEWLPIGSPWNTFLAMLLLYMGTSLLIWVAFHWVHELIDRVKLKEFDRQIGALFGLAKGVVLCMIITLFAVTLLGDQQRQSIIDSRSGYYIAVMLDRSHAVMPDELSDVLDPYLHTLDSRLPQQGSDTSSRWHAPALPPALPPVQVP